MMRDALLHLDISWLLLGTITFLTFFWFWTKTRRPYTQYNIPPFPVPPLPIVGHFFMIGFDFRQKVKEWREQTGDIFSFDIGGRHHIVVSGYDNIKQVLVKNADSIPNQPHLFLSDFLNERDKGIIAGRDGNWKEQRTTSLSILRDFGMGKNFLAQKIQEEVSVYIEKLADLQGRPHDIRLLTNISVSNVICAIIVGKRFEHEDPYFQRLVGKINDVLKYANRTFILTAFPFLYRLPGDLFEGKSWISSHVAVNEMFAKVYIRKFKEGNSENEEPDNFIKAYLHEMEKRKVQRKETQLSEDNLVTVIRNLIVAGTETTSTTILWCVLYMLYHPKVQEKVYQEIKEHVGTDRPPNMTDKPKLNYLNAVIMETQRMASLVPVGIRREVSAPFEVGGYTFPKGTTIWPNLDSVLHDKKIWGDPENFRPERFLADTGSLLKPEEFIPFSTGRRVCLGRGLAQMELFLFLGNMFQRFTFEPTDKSGQLPSTEGMTGATVVPFAFQVRFIERKVDI